MPDNRTFKPEASIRLCPDVTDATVPTSPATSSVARSAPVNDSVAAAAPNNPARRVIVLVVST